VRDIHPTQGGATQDGVKWPIAAFFSGLLLSWRAEPADRGRPL